MKKETKKEMNNGMKPTSEGGFGITSRPENRTEEKAAAISEDNKSGKIFFISEPLTGINEKSKKMRLAAEQKQNVESKQKMRHEIQRRMNDDGWNRRIADQVIHRQQFFSIRRMTIVKIMASASLLAAMLIMGIVLFSRPFQAIDGGEMAKGQIMQEWIDAQIIGIHTLSDLPLDMAQDRFGNSEYNELDLDGYITAIMDQRF